jgi:hypothetical protein
MSDESEVDRVLGRAEGLRKAVGRGWTVVIILFGLWVVRKRAGLAGVLLRLALLLGGIGTYGYWHGVFS